MEKKDTFQKLIENVWGILWSSFLILQILGGIFYYNVGGNLLITVIGWLILISGFMIGNMGVQALKKYGEVPEGKSFIRTTKVVNQGIYALVRHPQYLCWMFFNFAVILIAQNVCVILTGIISTLSVYLQARQDDQTLIKKFGEEYIQYYKSVPRMNFVTGLFRYYKRKKI